MYLDHVKGESFLICVSVGSRKGAASSSSVSLERHVGACEVDSSLDTRAVYIPVPNPVGLPR